MSPPAADGRGSALPRRVLIVGGGASGVLMARHLLDQPDELHVTLIEAAPEIGRGVAYAAGDPDHLLNTRVGNMSAFPEDPDHFLRWLRSPGGMPDATADSFVSRSVFGSYLAALLGRWLDPTRAGRLTLEPAACVSLRDTPDGVRAALDDGRGLLGDVAILATGHVQPPADPSGLVQGAWEAPAEVDPAGTVAILGTGLSMVDQVLTLLNRGHRGPILALSRRGLLPQVHGPSRPMALNPAEIPFGASARTLTRWLLQEVAWAEGMGGTWRDAVDGLRPHVQALWRALPVAERARLLRHAASLWEVHRHRMPPASATRIESALASGQLVVRRAAFAGARRDVSGRPVLRMRPVGASAIVEAPVARIIDCRGLRRDPVRFASPLIADLLAQGAARIEPLGIGLDVDPDSRVIDARGRPSDRLLALGPVARAAFWEITAIPDIRTQAAALARALTARSFHTLSPSNGDHDRNG